MQNIILRFLCILTCITAYLMHAENTCSTCMNNCTTYSLNDHCTSIFIPRSVGDNLVHQALYLSYDYKDDCCETPCFGGTFSVEYRYQQSRVATPLPAIFLVVIPFTFKEAQSKQVLMEIHLH